MKTYWTSVRTNLYIASVVTAGTAVLVYASSHWYSQDLTRFFCYLLAAVLVSALKVTLPGIDGTMSVNFLCILVAVVELSFAEAVLIGLAATLFQCLWYARVRPKPVQVAFNVASVATAIAASCLIYHSPLALKLSNGPVLLALAVITYFLTNTLPIAGVICLTEGKPLKKVWKECYFWSFPYYLVGASIAGLINLFNRYAGWQTSMLVMPIVVLIYRAYRLYLEKLADEKNHVSEMASLHLRTIEALAMAIDAKDNNTHEHLRRVQVNAVEIGRELNLADEQLEAIRAAALLHDIGKLAVPEHIISKPGKLRPEEFEKMKIHPVVGAEILAQVQFPYPVVPIVRSHHEKWDGSGYPDGLKGEEIPIGARILSVVDCLDALASDRPYRKALPLDDAMKRIVSEAGKSFDPQVVEILGRRYTELEQMSRRAPVGIRKTLSTDVKIARGAAPAAGFEAEASAAPEPAPGPQDFLSSIAAARQEFQMLFEVTHDLGNSLSLNETLSVLAIRLNKMVPYDAIAIYICQDRKLVPEFVNGEDFRLFSSLAIPVGEGLSGWVAENGKPILNGNPSVEPSYLNDPNKFSTMRSALAVPLEDVHGIIGVLALYRAQEDAFNNDHLRILLAVSAKVGLAVGNALKFQQVESSATTDALTGLPNARALFLHLDSELARSKRLHAPLAVLVCDLDGFKQVNDRFGHVEGNKLLERVARGLREACREYDYVARMGGDEFVFIIPGIGPSALDLKMLRLQQIAVLAGREVCGEDILSISVGHASYPENGADAEQLLAEADRRMYKAKQQQKLSFGNGLFPAFDQTVTTVQ